MKNIPLIACLMVLAILTSCVQETHQKTVYLKVDMSQLDVISNPGVKGQFSTPSWDSIIPLTDTDNDSIYEATITTQATHIGMRFTLVNNNSDEAIDNPRRSLDFEYKPQQIIYECVFNNPEGKQTEAPQQ